MSTSEDDLTTQEILSMWDEGDPVTVVSTRLEIDQVPWARTLESSARGTLAETVTRQFVNVDEVVAQSA